MKRNSENGFTLVELLLACAIILILGGLTVQAYKIHKDNAYHSVAMETMMQVRTALEAGKIDSENFPQNFMLTVNQDSAGPASGETAEMLVPGLVVPDNFKVFVAHNPACYKGSCVQDQIETRHCNTQRKVKFWQMYILGEPKTVFIDNADASADPACGGG